MTKEAIRGVIRVACEMRPEDRLYTVIALTGVQDGLAYGRPGKASKNGRTLYEELDVVWNAVSRGLRGGVIFCGTVPAGRQGLVSTFFFRFTLSCFSIRFFAIFHKQFVIRKNFFLSCESFLISTVIPNCKVNFSLANYFVIPHKHSDLFEGYFSLVG